MKRVLHAVFVCAILIVNSSASFVAFTLRGNNNAWVTRCVRPLQGNNLSLLIFGVGISYESGSYNSMAQTIASHTSPSVVCVVDSEPGSIFKPYPGFRNAYNTIKENINGWSEMGKVTIHPEKVFAGGHSAGGQNAFIYAKENPTNSAGIIAFDPVKNDSIDHLDGVTKPALLVFPNHSSYCAWQINTSINGQWFYNNLRSNAWSFKSAMGHNDVTNGGICRTWRSENVIHDFASLAGAMLAANGFPEAWPRTRLSYTVDRK